MVGGRTVRSSIERLREIPTASISDALENLGLSGQSGPNLRRVSGEGRACGTAVVIEVYEKEGDSGSVRLEGLNECLDALTPDSFLLIAWSTDKERSVVGGLAARRILMAGAVGVLNDGFLRDVDDLQSMGLRCWTRSITPLTGRRDLGVRRVSGSVITGIAASEGDVVVADDTGVCIIPRDHVSAVTEEAERIDSQERAIDELLRSGASMDDATRRIRAERPD